MLLSCTYFCWIALKINNNKKVVITYIDKMFLLVYLISCVQIN